MMGEYAAFLLILVFGFACGYGTARARGESKGKLSTLPEPTRPAPPMPEVKPAKEVNELPPPPPTRYAGFPDGHRKTEEARAQWEADMIEWQRRRDDNRAQRAPEEPWQ